MTETGPILLRPGAPCRRAAVPAALLFALAAASAEIPPDLAERAGEDPLACALLIARTTGFPMKVYAMATAGKTYWKLGMKERAEEALDWALDAARRAEAFRDQQIAAVALAFAETENFRKAEDAALLLGDEEYRKALVSRISADEKAFSDPDYQPSRQDARHDAFWRRKALALADEGSFSQALTLASVILHMGLRSTTMSEVVMKAAGKVDTGMLLLALRNAWEQCGNAGLGKYGRARSLTVVSNAYFALGRKREAAGVLREALEAAGEAQGSRDRDIELGGVAVMLAHGGRSGEARETAALVRDPRVRAEILARMAEAASGLDREEAERWLIEAAETLEEIPEDESPLGARLAIVKALAAVGDFDSALEKAAAFTDPSERALALVSLGTYWFDPGRQPGEEARNRLSRMAGEVLGK